MVGSETVRFSFNTRGTSVRLRGMRIQRSWSDTYMAKAVEGKRSLFIYIA